MEETVKIGRFTLKVLFKNGKWFECIQFENHPEVFADTGENDMEMAYIDSALRLLKVRSGMETVEGLNFAGRTLQLSRDREDDILSIQTGEEDDKGEYTCEVECVDKQKLFDIVTFFENASGLWLKEYLN